MESTILLRSKICCNGPTSTMSTMTTRTLLTAAVFVFAGLLFWDASSLVNASGSSSMNSRVTDDFTSRSMAVPAESLTLLPGDATIAPAAGDQTAPAIAQGGNVLLSVWSDTRANVTGGYEGETSRDIYGVRFDSNGNLLDAIPIAITAARATQDNPKVVWNGTNWLVVFESYDVGGTGYYQKSLAAVRVAPSGQVLDGKPIPLYGLVPPGGSYWAAASDGVNWIVVNHGNSTGSDIVAVRIAPSGVVLDSPTHVLAKASYYLRSNFKLAYAGGVFLLTFSDAYNNGVYDTKAIRFNGGLNLLDPAPLPFLGSPVSDLAANGTSFYVVWNRQNLDYTVNVAGSRVSTTGTRLDGNGVNLSGTKTPSGYSTTAVVWDGINWRVTWGELNTTYTARVNTAGQVLDPGSVAVAGLQTGLSAGNGAGGARLVWTVFANNNYDVYSGNITAGNTGGMTRLISVGAPRQLRPDIATSGNGYMVVYRSSTSNQGRVLAQPLDASGNPTSVEPVVLESGLNINGPGNPNVAWNGSLYLVSWSSTNGIVGQRLSETGVKLDAAPFMVMSGCFGTADVAALGSNFLVTGLKAGISIQYIGPVAARVSGTGTVLDSSPLFLGNSYVRNGPAVVALGGRWLAAWHRNATHDNSYCISMGAFIDPVGTVTPEFQIHGPFSTAGGNGIFEVGFASSGNKALFVQSQELTSGVENDLLGRVIDVTGAVGPQVNLTPWSGNQYKPRVAWDGTNFIVAYQDQKNSLAAQGLEQLDARSDLFAMRVTPTGAIIDPQGFVFSALQTGETDPAVVSLNGVSFLAGSAVINDANYANYRIEFERRDASLNKWPIAVAAAAPSGGDVPLNVSFSSAGSTDLDGTIAGYFWDFGDGTVSTAVNPSHTYTITGPFVATLTVTDNGGAQARQTILVKAMAPNQLPIAVASAVPVSGALPLDVIFYADGSYDPDGFLGNLQWNFSDGGTYYGSPAYHTFSSVGTYTATLTVYDSRGATGTASVVIYAGTTPSPTPTPTPSPSPTPSPVPEFDLTISQSDAPDPVASGQPLTYTLTVSIVPTALGGSASPQVAFTFPNGVPVIFNSAIGTNGYTATLSSNTLLFTGGTISTNGTNAGTATLTVVLTPQSTGTLTSPGANVVVDPNNLVNESNEANNTAATVTTTVMAASKTLFDFDGDRKSDISLFRPSTGAWYLQQSQAGFLAKIFGVSTDRITPADFDGDGKTDIAVYRPSTGTWYVFNSSSGTISYSLFGIAEDLPAPGDYDGDGKADLAVFRPSTGFCYRLNSSNGAFVGVHFGASGDRPTIGDFDGDSRADISVYRPSSGSWYRLNSSNGLFVSQQFGLSTDLIVPADYDGDGKTDIAVYRPTTSNWYVINSSNASVRSVVFGLATDIPAPADFDGDGRADVSVFRPSNGSWYRLNSSDGLFYAIQFGTNGDRPTPSAFGN